MTLAAFSAALSMTCVWMVVPAIARHWALGPGEVHWVSSGFMAATVPAMLATPWLLRHLGAREASLLALAMLVAGAATSASASGFGQLVLGRALEGAAAGILQPLPVLVVARLHGPATRGRAMGLFTLGLTLAPALSPAIAGMLAEHLGWRTALLAPLPFALAAAVALLVALPSVGQVEAAGAALRLALLRDREFRGACAVAFVYGMAVFAMGYLVPVFVQDGLQRSAATAGVALLPSGLALAAASPFGGRLSDRWPRHRLIALGMGVFAAAHLPILALSPSASLAWLAACLVLSRLGMALALPSLALDALRGLPRSEWAAGTTLVSLSRQAGAVLGIWAASALVAWRLSAEEAMLPALQQSIALTVIVCSAGAWAAWRNAPRTGG